MLKSGYQQARLGGDVLLAGLEYAGRYLTEPIAKAMAPRPESNRAVITMPGFTGGEDTVSSINRFLEGLGYEAEPWGLGRNRGYPNRDYFLAQLNYLAQKTERRADKTGQKVSLVGHSLGGVYAREVARYNPAIIDRVITLGSPAHLGNTRASGVNPTVRAAYMAANTKKGAASLAGRYRATRDAPPPDVPLVSIYSRLDAVVSVDAARIPDHFLEDTKGTPRENLEVAGSHMGMSVNSLMLLAIADRLAQSTVDWKPFNAASYLPLHLRLPMGFALNLFYPEPVPSGAT